MHWLERWGLFCDFLSFWFVAPEILGEERLRRYERAIENTLTKVPGFTVGTAMVIVMYVFGIGVILLMSYLGIRELALFWRILIVAGELMLFGVLSLLAIGLAEKISEWINLRLIQPLLHKLADESRIRQRALLAGVVLYVLGFLLQLAGTF